ncbi:MAG: hypothetical protein Q8P18_02395 [Pseudomonadota bacterium]|nr:hypothetical protein [Pseudomonadota bacterium]
MSRTLLAFLFLTACAPGTIKLADDTAAPVDDTAADDTSADTDVDDTDTDDTDVEDTDVEPVMVPDYSVWNATRRFFYSDFGYECDETVLETGTVIAEGTSDYDALHALCGICDYFYEIEPDRESACDGYLEFGTGWRGVVLSDGAAAVYFFREADGGLEEYASDEGAAFDGTVIEFGYQFDYWNYFTVDVSGAITYPLIEQE